MTMNIQTRTKTSKPGTDRGEEARIALITAAIDAFGQDGFDAVSTRRIADAAGVNQAMISYYFGGKKKLYLAAIGHITEQIGGRMGPVAAELLTVAAPPVRAGAKARRLHYTTLLLQLLRPFLHMLTSQESAAWARLIMREHQQPSEGFDLLYEGAMKRVIGAMSGLVGQIHGRETPSREDRLQALTLLGQVLIFRAARAGVLRVMQWDDIRQTELQAIEAMLAANLGALFQVPVRLEKDDE